MRTLGAFLALALVTAGCFEASPRPQESEDPTLDPPPLFRSFNWTADPAYRGDAILRFHFPADAAEACRLEAIAVGMEHMPGNGVHGFHLIEPTNGAAHAISAGTVGFGARIQVGPADTMALHTKAQETLDSGGQRSGTAMQIGAGGTPVSAIVGEKGGNYTVVMRNIIAPTDYHPEPLRARVDCERPVWFAVQGGREVEIVNPWRTNGTATVAVVHAASAMSGVHVARSMASEAVDVVGWNGALEVATGTFVLTHPSGKAFWGMVAPPVFHHLGGPGPYALDLSREGHANRCSSKGVCTDDFFVAFLGLGKADGLAAIDGRNGTWTP